MYCIVCVRLGAGSIRAGGSKNLGRYVLPGFQKMCLQNLFFGMKLGSPEQNFTEICFSGTKTLVKIGKNWS